MKHILVDGKTPETFRLVEFVGREIKDFRVHYEGKRFSRKEVLEVIFTDGTSMMVKST